LLPLALAVIVRGLQGQSVPPPAAGLPNVPVAAQVAAPAQNQTPPDPYQNEPKRIFGVFPNYRSVHATQHLPAQSVKQKFSTATGDSFDYSASVLPALIAAEQERTTAFPEFHGGMAGYGRYLWHSAVDQTSENYIVEFIVPALTREDTRYYALGKRRQRAWKRAGYALSRLVLTRSDSGKATFNVGEVFGAALGASVSNLYYPAPERTVGKTMGKYATNVGVDAFAFLVREFWPDANHILFRGPDPRLAP